MRLWFLILQTISPLSLSKVKSMSILDTLSVLWSSSVRSGLITCVLANLGAIDTAKLSRWEVWVLGLVVFAISSATRIWNSGVQAVPPAAF